jgi:hypothetical protein
MKNKEISNIKDLKVIAKKEIKNKFNKSFSLYENEKDEFNIYQDKNDSFVDYNQLFDIECNFY